MMNMNKTSKSEGTPPVRCSDQVSLRISKQKSHNHSMITRELGHDEGDDNHNCQNNTADQNQFSRACQNSLCKLLGSGLRRRTMLVVAVRGTLHVVSVS